MKPPKKIRYPEKLAVCVLRALIWLYRHSFSLVIGRECRFQPTCSAYAQEALQKHGLRKGLSLTVKRLAACRPGGESGFDPVP